MEKQTSMGTNRTGIDMSPIDSKEMSRGAREYTNAAAGRSQLREKIEQQYLDAANQIGSVPLPGTMKGAFKATMQKASGRHPEVFINKLGQRLAFERTGTRLYEAVIRKCRVLAEAGEQLPFELTEIDHIRSEELEHFHLLKECLTQIGADPTAITPDANVSAVASMGYQRALCDPRTNVPQCLNLLLELELADVAAWDMLIELADDMGMDEMVRQFRQAKSEEDEHERKLRSWCKAAVKAEAGKEPRTQH